MKIIITGCAGMIGCYLTLELLISYPSKEGHEIIGMIIYQEEHYVIFRRHGDKFDD